MPDLHSLVDRLYYTNRRDYTVKKGNVAYLDASPLKRSLSMPAGQRVVAIIIVAAAIILGVLFVNNTVLASIREAEAAEKAITDNLARQASIDTVPIMSDLVKLDDDEIRAAFANAGYTIFDASALNTSVDMALYKLPADMTTDEAAGMLSKGVNSLTAAEATKLLNGSWYFATERSGGTSMVVRYADFATADPQVAVVHALEKQGIDSSTISESGVDDSGNTFSMGTAEIGKKAYTWKISALPLGDMYSINKMPEGACYVGVRFTAQ